MKQMANAEFSIEILVGSKTCGVGGEWTMHAKGALSKGRQRELVGGLGASSSG